MRSKHVLMVGLGLTCSAPAVAQTKEAILDMMKAMTEQSVARVCADPDMRENGSCDRRS